MKNLFGFIALIVFTYSISTKAQNTKQPNIVFILADDLGWKDLSCTGSTFYETPHIDVLAEKGMLFNYAYAPAPVCAPSRGAILNGKAPGRTKYTNVFLADFSPNDSLYDISKQYGVNNQNLEARHGHTLPSTATLLPELLKTKGYTTGFLGKWHCGIMDGYRPEDRGFDMAGGYFKQGDGSIYKHYLNDKILPNLVNLPKAKDGDWLEDRLAESACDFIEANKDKPFYLHYCSYLVHGPPAINDKFLNKYESKPTTDQSSTKLATMISSLDESVGKIVAQLERLGILDNTLIVFTSDNGGKTPGTSVYPLMGGKSFAFEAGRRVPMIVYWANQVKPGSFNDTKVTGLDFYPTFLDITGITNNPNNIIDGNSLKGEFTGTSRLPQRTFYSHYPHYTHATSPHSTIIHEGWKLIRYYNDAEGRFALYNLQDDPYEQKDLWESMPEKVTFLDNMLQEYLLSIDAEFPTPVDSEKGQLLVERYHKGLLKGKIKKKKKNSRSNLTEVKNKKTELDLALKERKKAEKALGI